MHAYVCVVVVVEQKDDAERVKREAVATNGPPSKIEVRQRAHVYMRWFLVRSQEIKHGVYLSK